MLANTDIDLRDLVVLDACDIVEENVVGVRLPLLRRIEPSVVELLRHVEEGAGVPSAALAPEVLDEPVAPPPEE